MHAVGDPDKDVEYLSSPIVNKNRIVRTAIADKMAEETGKLSLQLVS